jgi:hypothetical protein
MCRTLGDKRGFLRVPHSFASLRKGGPTTKLSSVGCFRTQAQPKIKAAQRRPWFFPKAN